MTKVPSSHDGYGTGVKQVASDYLGAEEQDEAEIKNGAQAFAWVFKVLKAIHHKVDSAQKQKCTVKQGQQRV